MIIAIDNVTNRHIRFNRRPSTHFFGTCAVYTRNIKATAICCFTPYRIFYSNICNKIQFFTIYNPLRLTKLQKFSRLNCHMRITRIPLNLHSTGRKDKAGDRHCQCQQHYHHFFHLFFLHLIKLCRREILACNLILLNER